MAEEFPIIDVSKETPHQSEAMGTKPKFWYRDEEGRLSLYKQARSGTGEDWAEKITAELAELLGLPHARYELASWGDTRGAVSPSFVPEQGELVHGNELLRWFVPDYPSRRFYRVSEHTLENVWAVLEGEQPKLPLDWTPPGGISDATGIFVGYLLLDAWTGNTDRHHQNWGLVCVFPGPPLPDVVVHLAPTFDHASSLGRELTDVDRSRRLTTKDQRYSVGAYVDRCTSALYAKEGDRKPLTTMAAFGQAARAHVGPALAWLDRLSQVGSADTLSLLERVPAERISPAATGFAQRMLELNRQRLLDLRESLR